MNEKDLALKWKFHITNGDFESAWKINDIIFNLHRQKNLNTIPRHFQIIWNGSSLNNKTVLIRCYHGLGDTIQFIRYLPLVEAVASKTFVWVQPELIKLLETMKTKAVFLPLNNESPPVEYDVDIELMELPYIFRTNINNIPANVPYLHIDAQADDKTNAIKAGIVWKSGDWDKYRSIPYDQIISLSKIKDLDLYILQKGSGLIERTEDFGILSGSEDVYKAARIIKSLDVVISVDTMIPHLAGALGVPVWLLLNSKSDWRWLDKRSDSPWYPTMRIFRQETFGKWDSVINEVKRELSLL
ncbi:MAG: hypothetical protein A2Y10_08400 [Planctomycetes bacterium GWF2_41_51]|nr:MAG: hypothetical protein A2Y10_08400 [Planctomycetes bacterium GWF2_41_51]HBG27057.1 ADP-heptose--LPS heptosyltransferase [Phycisphaerales bacterium]